MRDRRSTRRNPVRSTLHKSHSAPRLLVDYSKCKAPVNNTTYDGIRRCGKSINALFDGVSSQRSLFENTSDHQSRKEVRRRTSARSLAAMMGDDEAAEEDPFRPINLSSAKNPVLGSSFSSLMDILDQKEPSNNRNNSLSALRNVSFRVRKSALVEFNDDGKLEESRFTSSFSTLQRSVIDCLARTEDPYETEDAVCKRSVFAGMKGTAGTKPATAMPCSSQPCRREADDASSCSSTSTSSSKVAADEENTKKRGGGRRILADSSRLSRSFHHSRRHGNSRLCDKSSKSNNNNNSDDGSIGSNGSDAGDWFLQNNDDILLIDNSEASLQSSFQRLRAKNHHTTTIEPSPTRNVMDIEWQPPAAATIMNKPQQQANDISWQKPVPTQVKDISSWQKPMGGTPLAATTKKRSKSCNNLLLSTSGGGLGGGGKDHRRKSFTRNPLGDMVSLLELHDSNHSARVDNNKKSVTSTVKEEQTPRRRRSHHDLRSLLESNPAKRSSFISCRAPSSRNVVCDISVASTIESISTTTG